MLSEKQLHELAEKMVNNPTYHESIFIKKLKDSKVNYQTQVVIGFYIADFVIPDKMLVIELDGDCHRTEKGLQRDKHRDKFLKKYGFKILRVDNVDSKNFDLSEFKKFPDVDYLIYEKALIEARSKMLTKYHKKRESKLPKLTQEQRRKRNNQIANKRKKVKRKALRMVR